MDESLSRELRELVRLAEEVSATHIAPLAETVDREARWPAHAFRALSDAGLMGLQVPKRLGGHGQGLLALGRVVEAIAQACPSSALCFGMHCVGSAVIAAKATKDQEERYLRPIAEGRHITTLALSESGAGAYFYLPQTKLGNAGDAYLVDGTKQFVTNGGHADSYVVSTLASVESDAGDFSCLVVDGKGEGLSWLAQWEGLGMRGNASRGLKLDAARVPKANLLGEEGDQVWYVFEVVAPYFLMAMSAVYLGIAASALELAVADARSREHTHTGQTLAAEPVVQYRMADLWLRHQQARQLVYETARLADVGDPSTLPMLLASKTAAATAAVDIANGALDLGGGRAYRDNGRLAQALRDARAGHVMAPTTDLLKLWLGRAILDVPLL